MNRKERRRNKIKTHEPVYNMKRSQIEDAVRTAYQGQIKEKLEEAYARGRKDSIDEAFLLMIAIPLKVMHDMYGWGQKKRLPEFAEYITDEYQRFSDGDMTTGEYKQFVFETCGIKFELAEEE